MANTLVTPTWVLREVTRKFLNSLGFAKNIKRYYDDSFKAAGAKVGDTIKLRLPQQYTVTRGQALQTQDLYDSTVSLTLTDQINIGFGWSSAQATLELEQIRDRYIDPAASRLANEVDLWAMAQLYADVYNSIGTPGSGAPSTTLEYLTVGTMITYQAGPIDGRKATLDPIQMATIANAGTTLFNPQQQISSLFRKGIYGEAALGIAEWYQDSNCPNHTTGTYTASTPLVNGANQTGSSLITDGWASGATTLKKGDIFTIAGVYSVNPLSQVSSGQLQQFVVTADISDTTGDMTIAISPSIITSGARQTVSGSPANNAVITVLGATSPTAGTLATTVSKQGLIYHEDAFALGSADLAMPNGGASASRVSSREGGLSIRFVEQFQITNDQNLNRLDILAGVTSVQPRWAVRVQS